MKPLSLDLAFIIEDGPVVTLLGIDRTSGQEAAVQIDLHPASRARAVRQVSSKAVTFAASGLSASVDFALEAASNAETRHDG